MSSNATEEAIGARKAECVQDTAGRRDVSEAQIGAFLTDNEFHVTRIVPYAEGVASRNFRAVGPGGLDLTVRCDFRRSIEQVREDRIYSELANRDGISVPLGAWLDGRIHDVATTVRPTIGGASLTQLAGRRLPSPDRIARLLARLHGVAPPANSRRFFYDGLFDQAHPLWQSFEMARGAHRADAGIGALIDEASDRLERSVPRLRKVTEGRRTMIHGDFNPPNILLSNADLVLIDWDKACGGFPVADLTQAIYYFSACYGCHDLAFAGEFTHAYTKVQRISRRIVDVWLQCFPAFIFLRDVVSAIVQPMDCIGRMQLARFEAYLRQDSAPRFRYFLGHEKEIRDAVLSADNGMS